MSVQRFPTIADALGVYVLDGESRNVAPRTLASYRQRLGRFVAYCDAANVATIDAITPALLRQYLADMRSRGLAAYTQLGAYRDLRAFLNFCVREGWLQVSPVANVKPPRVEKRTPEVFTPTQARQLAQAAPTARDKAIVLLLLDTGLRAMELCSLDGRDIDMQSGAVYVRQGKGRKDRTVYAGAHARRALARYFADQGRPGDEEPMFVTYRGERMGYGALAKMLRRIGRHVGFPVRAHTFRRTFATEALRNGWDIYTLRDAMGHEDIAVLRHYLAIAGSDVERSQRTMGVLDGMFGD